MTIKLAKPNALTLAASAQIQITRRRDDFPDVFSARGSAERSQPLPTSSSLHSVALALGSNLGDRFAHIETALCLLEVPTSLLSDLREDAQVDVVDTSFMYETAPMYVTDQPRFANCACMVRLFSNIPSLLAMFIASLDQDELVSQELTLLGQGDREGGWQSARRALRSACGRRRHSNI